MEHSSWITDELLREVLSKDETFAGKSVHLKSFDFNRRGLAKGWSSTIFRVHVALEVDGEESSWSYIAKTSLGAPSPIEVLKQKEFPTEIEVLTRLIPRFEALYREQGEEVSFGPRCFKVLETPESFSMVLEDLRQSGFRASGNDKGLNLPHILLCVERMAQFHAASVVFQHQNGPYPEVFRVRDPPTEELDAYYRKQLGIFLDVARTWPDFEHAVEIIESHAPEIHRLLHKYLALEPDDFAVLCHADIHYNNVVFQYPEHQSEDPRSAKLLDFQLAFWSSPIYDLLFLLVVGANNETRDKEFDTTFYRYRTILSESLKKLKWEGKVPGMKELQIDFLNRGVVALILVIQAMTQGTKDPSQTQNEENADVSSEEEARRHFGNPSFRKKATRFINFLITRGVLEKSE